MKIIKSFPEELTKRDAFKLTEAPASKKLMDLAGSIIEPTRWVLGEDEDKTVLALEVDGEIYSTISVTFIDAFVKAFDALGADMFPVKVVAGTSKANRPYLLCELA